MDPIHSDTVNTSIVAPLVTGTTTSKTLLGTTLIALAILALLSHVLTTSHDAREPPSLKPRIPFVGHLLSMIRHRTKFLQITYDRAGHPALASLPILNGKLYAIWDASLIQSAYANRHLAFAPFIVEFLQREVDYSDEVHRIVVETTLMDDMFAAIRDAMTLRHTNAMGANALTVIADRLHMIRGDAEWQVIPNFYLWTRDLMTVATTHGLYGPEDPLQKYPTLVKDMW